MHRARAKRVGLRTVVRGRRRDTKLLVLVHGGEERATGGAARKPMVVCIRGEAARMHSTWEIIGEVRVIFLHRQCRLTTYPLNLSLPKFIINDALVLVVHQCFHHISASALTFHKKATNYFLAVRPTSSTCHSCRPHTRYRSMHTAGEKWHHLHTTT